MKTLARVAALSCMIGLTDCTATTRHPAAMDSAQRPNFIVILVDDMGYGDLGCYGSPVIKTPRLDRMANEGLRLTSCYSQPVCGPARAALMTGCYPTRVMRGKWTLPSSEITVAEVLSKAGYTTACVGKWDLSGRKLVPDMLPVSQGFDSYFGTLGANDGGRVTLVENRQPRGETTDMGSLTGMYTDRAIAFIRQHKSEPFFLYLAHTMPHTIIGASEHFRGHSPRGLYGDVVQELDWNVGRVLDTVKECGLDDKTVVVFLSDNGPWLSKGEMGGSASPLRGGKGSAWEGGLRVPCIIRAPGRVPAGRTSGEMMATLDVLPTFAGLAGAQVPSDRVIDGKDQGRLITGRAEHSARETFLYYVKDNLHAVREGRWKLALPNRKIFYPYAKDEVPVSAPQLYDLQQDIGETTDVAGQHPDIVQKLLQLAESARADIGDLETIGRNARSRPAE